MVPPPMVELAAKPVWARRTFNGGGLQASDQVYAAPPRIGYAAEWALAGDLMCWAVCCPDGRVISGEWLLVRGLPWARRPWLSRVGVAWARQSRRFGVSCRLSNVRCGLLSETTMRWNA